MLDKQVHNNKVDILVRKRPLLSFEAENND